jgi:hypothetical protein
VIDFIVYDMTHIRYFFPLTASLSRLGFKTRWLIKHSDAKYNAIFGERVSNVAAFAEQAGCGDVGWFTDGSVGDTAITVETGTPSDNIPHRFRSVVSMQHGFDYVGPQRPVLPNVTYVMWDQIYSEDHMRARSGSSYLVPPTPVAFWVTKEECNRFVGLEKCVTVFYPEDGLHDLVRSACDEIISLGYMPVIKQRRKNQPVPQLSDCKVVYDDVWHLSESVAYPVASAFCVGFGTGAYTDAVSAGLTFLDCPSPQYSKLYLKPTSRHFIVTSEDQIKRAIQLAAETPSAFKETTLEQRDQFTLSLMEGMNVQRS